MIERVELHIWRGSYLYYTDDGLIKPGAKTRQFSVKAKNGSLVGYIKWWASWRQYCFFPLNSIFDPKCLREVAEFCEQATSVHKSRIPGNEKRLKGLEKARRQRRIEKLALTKQNSLGKVDSVETVVQPENELVEGVTNLTPLK